RCAFQVEVTGKRWSSQPNKPVVSTVFSPAMKRLLLFIRGVFCVGQDKATRASGLVVFVDTDNDAGVAQVLVRRNFQIVWRGLVLVDAAGHVERGAVAGAQEAALPVAGHACPATRFEMRRGRTAQVRADADTDKEFGF